LTLKNKQRSAELILAVRLLRYRDDR